MGDFYTIEEPQQHKKKKSTIDFKLIIGVVLILVSIALSIISNVIVLGGIYRLSDDAVQSSVYLLAPVVIILFLSSLILIFGKDKRGRNLMIFSILAVVLNFNNLYTSIREAKIEAEREKVAIEKVLNLVKDFMAEKEIIREDISEEKYGKTAPLIEVIQNNYLDYQKIREDVNSIAQIVNDSTSFSNEILKDPDKIKEKIAIMDKTSKDIEGLDNRIKEYMEKFKDDIANVYISGVVKDEINSNLNYTVYTYNEIASKNLEYMNRVILRTKDMLSFLDGKQGEYEVKNDKAVFFNNKDMEEYNELYKLYDQAVAENIWNYQTVIDMFDEKVKELEDYINKLNF